MKKGKVLVFPYNHFAIKRFNNIKEHFIYCVRLINQKNNQHLNWSGMYHDVSSHLTLQI